MEAFGPVICVNNFWNISLFLGPYSHLISSCSFPHIVCVKKENLPSYLCQSQLCCCLRAGEAVLGVSESPRLVKHAGQDHGQGPEALVGVVFCSHCIDRDPWKYTLHLYSLPIISPDALQNRIVVFQRWRGPPLQNAVYSVSISFALKSGSGIDFPATWCSGVDNDHSLDMEFSELTADCPQFTTYPQNTRDTRIKCFAETKIY